jgi:redox-sensing transcriptional repressor
MYHRYLQGLLRNGTHVISSADLAHFTNVNPAQLRKDLSYFGKFGVRGVGYQVEQLVSRIQNILGLGKEWRMALVGVNYIGQALLQYNQFEKRGYNFVAAFDLDEINTGQKIGNLFIKPINALDEAVEKDDIDFGVITVSNERAQEVANALVKAGIKGILNFSAARLDVPDDIDVRNIDFTVLLDTMTYTISRRNGLISNKISKNTYQKDHENQQNRFDLSINQIAPSLAV